MTGSIWQRAHASMRARWTEVRRRRAARIPELVGRSEAFFLKREFQRSFLLQQGLLPSHSFLDYGCGVLRGGLPLIEYLNPNKYVGLDVREKVIRIAKREVRKAGLKGKRPMLIPLRTSDNLALDRRADFAWAFSVLFHLSDEPLASCLSFISKHLGPSGVFFANANVGERASGEWLEFPVIWRSLADYERQANNVGLKVAAMGALSEFGHNSPTDPTEDQQIMLRFQLQACRFYNFGYGRNGWRCENA